MKTILKMLALGALSALPLSSIASTDCPPANSIQTKSLNQAAYLSKQYWSLTSETFRYNSRDWNILFITELPGVNNAQEALRQGIDRYKRTVITNNDPYPQNSDSISYCYYTSPTGKNRLTAMSFSQDG